MEFKLNELRKKMPSKRALAKQFDSFVQQKAVSMLYPPATQQRIYEMAELIRKATCGFEKEENWANIMQVVDELSSISNKDVLKESIRCLRIRLEDPDHKVVIHALWLTEAVVKNCGHAVHAEIATESFMDEMQTLYKDHCNKRGRDSMEIASRVLDLIQGWGEAFLPLRHRYPLFIETYHNMRKRGVKFPTQYDASRVPVLTPGVDPFDPSGGLSSASSFSAGARSSSSTSDSLPQPSNCFGDLTPLEVVSVTKDVTEMLEDMLHEAAKPDSNITDNGVLLELVGQAQELIQRMEQVIQTAVSQDDANLERLLCANDRVLECIKQFQRIQRQKQLDKQKKQRHQAEESERAKQKRQLQKQKPSVDNQWESEIESASTAQDDDPFDLFVHQRASSYQKPSEASDMLQLEDNQHQDQNQSHSRVDEEDDDPFAEFVQQRLSKVSTEPQRDLIDLWDTSDNNVELTANGSAHNPHEIKTSPLEATPLSTTSNQSRSSSTNPFDFFEENPPATVTLPVAAPPASVALPIASPASSTLPPSQPKSANPFDLFDDFTTSPAPSTGSSTTPCRPPSSNPFDF